VTIRNAGSFRDPAAYVFHQDNRILRGVTQAAAGHFAQTMASGIVERLAAKGLMVGCQKIEAGALELARFAGARGEPIEALYEHPALPFVSYPYEWCFSQLRDAALAHLDLQLDALEAGFVLTDASAYNMQFLEGRPIHIDVMSLRRYRNGQHWEGYNQFCRQFLLPLLIEAWTGLRFQKLYRGSMAGISFEDAMMLLPRRRLFTSMGGLMHVYLQGRAIMAKTATSREGPVSVQPLPMARYRSILEHLRGFISSLTSSTRPKSYWNDYAANNTYSDAMRSAKLDFIRQWAERAKPASIADIGGNTGDFSLAAIESGATTHALVLDSDVDAIEHGYRSRRSPGLLHLVMNTADPSPDLGWRQCERQGLAARAKPGGVIALAVIHHMVVGGNLPLPEVIDWFLDMAPHGVIEFVPKSDPMVVEMLMLREDIFTDYTEENFLALVSKRARITGRHKFDNNGRLLVSYERL
jgi:ribosomal protein L11 methylase PrmA